MNTAQSPGDLPMTQLQLQERLKVAVEAAKLAFWEWNPNFHRLNWDSAMYHLHGITRDADIDIGRWKDLVKSEDKDLMAEAFTEFVESRAGGEFEFRIVRPDGSIRHLRTVTQVIAEEETDALRVVGTCIDITESKREEFERERIIGELQELLMKVKMLSGLIPICGWCKSIRSDQGYWQTVEQYVRANTAATFSHGICPDCAEKMKAEIASHKGETSGK